MTSVLEMLRGSEDFQYDPLQTTVLLLEHYNGADDCV